MKWKIIICVISFLFFSSFFVQENKKDTYIMVIKCEIDPHLFKDDVLTGYFILTIPVDKDFYNQTYVGENISKKSFRGEVYGSVGSNKIIFSCEEKFIDSN